jgi:hypothetical protein
MLVFTSGHLSIIRYDYYRYKKERSFTFPSFPSKGWEGRLSKGGLGRGDTSHFLGYSKGGLGRGNTSHFLGYSKRRVSKGTMGSLVIWTKCSSWHNV